MTDNIQLLQFLLVCGVEIDSKYKDIHLETAQTEKPKLLSSFCFNESSKKNFEKVLKIFEQLDIYSKVFPMDINFWNKLMIDEVKIIKNFENYVKIVDKTITPIFHCFNNRILDNDEDCELFFHCYLFWDEIERKVFNGTLKKEIKKIAIPKAIILVTYDPCFNFCKLLLSTLSQQKGITDPVHFFSKLYKGLTVSKDKVNNIKITSGLTINIDYKLFYNSFLPLCDINLDFMFKLFKLSELFHLIQIILEGELFIVVSNDFTILYPIYYCLTMLIHPLEATGIEYNFNLLSPITSKILHSQLNFLTQNEKASLFVYTTSTDYDEYFQKLAQNKTDPITVIKVVCLCEDNYTTKIYKYYKMPQIEHYDKEYPSKMEIECLNESTGCNMSSFSESWDTLSSEMIITTSKSEEIQTVPAETSYFRSNSRKSIKSTRMPPVMRRKGYFKPILFDYCLRKNKLFFLKIYKKLQDYFEEINKKGPISFYDGKSKNFVPIQNIFFKLILFVFLSINYQIEYNSSCFPQINHSYDKNFNMMNLKLFDRIKFNNLLDISKPLTNHNYEDLVLLYVIINYHNNKKLLDCDFLNHEQFDVNLSLEDAWINNQREDSFFQFFLNILHKKNQRFQKENIIESQEEKKSLKEKLLIENDNFIVMSEVKLVYFFYKSNIIQLENIEQKEMFLAKFLYCFVYSLFLLNKVIFTNDFDEDFTFNQIYKLLIESNGFKGNFNFIISFILIIISSNKNYENAYLAKIKTFLSKSNNFSPGLLRILKQIEVNQSIFEKKIEIKSSKIIHYWLSDESGHLHSNFSQVYTEQDKFCFFCNICQKELFIIAELREENSKIKIKKPSELIDKLLYQLIKKETIYFPIKDEDSLFDYEEWKKDYILINFYGTFLQTLSENNNINNEDDAWEKINYDD